MASNENGPGSDNGNVIEPYDKDHRLFVRATWAGLGLSVILFVASLMYSAGWLGAVLFVVGILTAFSFALATMTRHHARPSRLRR